MKLHRYRPGQDDPVAIYDAWRAGHIRRCPRGFWAVQSNARAVLEALWEREGIPLDEVPRHCRHRWFEERVSTLLRLYRYSPYLLLTSLYPGRWKPSDFPEMPKADDLQIAAFTAEGLEWDPDPMRRWGISQKIRSERQGKCRMCHRPRDTDTIYCSYHLRMIRERERKRYQERRAQGLCYRCGSRPAEKAGACLPCYQRILLTRARQRQRHYWRNKALGLCGHWRCNEPAIPGQTRCEKHRREERERYYRLNYREKARINRMRRRNKNAPPLREEQRGLCRLANAASGTGGERRKALPDLRIPAVVTREREVPAMKRKPLGLETHNAEIRTACRLIVLDQDDGHQLAAIAIRPEDPKSMDNLLETYETTWKALLWRISPTEWNGSLLRVVLQRHTGDLWYLCVGTATATAKALSLGSVTLYQRARGELWNYWDIRMEQSFVDTWLDHVRKRGYLWLVVTDGTEAYFPDLTVRIPASAVLVRKPQGY